jgi:rubrerythrin
MKTYATVRDVLNAAQAFHRQLADFYAQLSECADRDKTRYLLEYFSRHEKTFEEALDEYTEEGADALLDTYMQYAPAEEQLEIPKAAELSPDMDVDQVENIARRLNDSLIDFYEQAAEKVKARKVRDLFLKLKEQQQDDKRKQAHNASAIRRNE